MGTKHVLTIFLILIVFLFYFSAGKILIGLRFFFLKKERKNSYDNLSRYICPLKMYIHYMNVVF